MIGESETKFILLEKDSTKRFVNTRRIGFIFWQDWGINVNGRWDGLQLIGGNSFQCPLKSLNQNEWHTCGFIKQASWCSVQYFALLMLNGRFCGMGIRNSNQIAGRLLGLHFLFSKRTKGVMRCDQIAKSQIAN